MTPPDDLLAAPAVRDPHTVLRRMREHDPVFWSARHKVYILTAYADVLRVFQDRTMSTAQGIGAFRRRLGAQHAGLLHHAMALLDGWMLFNDSPTHERLRDPVRRAFAPSVVEGLRTRIQAHVHTLLDQLDSRCDLVADFAQPLTARVICDLLGVDVSEQGFLREWTRDFGRLIYGASSRDAAYLDAVARAGDAFFARFRPLVAARQDDPGDDLLGRLIEAARRAAWTEAELIGACSMLLFAGQDTTSALIPSALLALASRPERLAALRTDPARLPSAIEECLRFDGPAKTFIRVPTAPLELGGHPVAAGQHLWLSILGANRDPAVFAAPDELRIDRNPNPHIAFGAGVHFCLGSALARAEAEIAIGAVLARFPRFRLLPGELNWSPTVVDRSLLALPVALT